MSILVRNIFRFIIFILIQVLLLNRQSLHQIVSPPYIYFLFLAWLPFKLNTKVGLIIGLCYGIIMDAFTNTYGMHAAACVLIMFLRPSVLNILMGKNFQEAVGEEPTIKSLGGITSYSLYLGVLISVHHLYLFFIQAFTFGNIFHFLKKTIASIIVSIILIFIAELLFQRKKTIGSFR